MGVGREAVEEAVKARQAEAERTGLGQGREGVTGEGKFQTPSSQGSWTPDKRSCLWPADTSSTRLLPHQVGGIYQRRLGWEGGKPAGWAGGGNRASPLAYLTLPVVLLPASLAAATTAECQEAVPRSTDGAFVA